MNISIAEAHNHLSSLLKQVHKGPVFITQRGKPVGVIIAPEEYERLSRVKAYLQLVDIARELKDGPSAQEIYHLSRQELEDKA